MNDAGAFPCFASAAIREEWESERVSCTLRMVIVVSDFLYREQGNARLRIIKILGDGIYKYGTAADVSPLGLPGVFRDVPGAKYASARFVVNRLNALFPYGDGLLETAKYEGDKIVLRVPPLGYPARSCALAEWARVGVVPGRRMAPQAISLEATA